VLVLSSGGGSWASVGGASTSAGVGAVRRREVTLATLATAGR
jgi:hypothetical protein